MCSVCGCGQGEARIEGQAHDHDHDHHDPAPVADHPHTHHDEPVPRHAHAPGLDSARMVQIEQAILDKNDRYAAANRRHFTEQGILAINLVSGPGAGKTSLLTRTLTDLQASLVLTVIEGDQQTSRDAERIRATGVKAVQINTGKGCHLDAHMVGHALETLQPPEGSVLFIENVGNLVCPAAFDLGEAHKVVLLSVADGEDKPLKYPDMFLAADLLLITKIDLLPHLDFDLARCIDHARRINPGLRVLPIAATTGEGLADWYAWLQAARRMALTGHPAAEA